MKVMRDNFGSFFAQLILASHALQLVEVIELDDQMTVATESNFERHCTHP